MITNLPFELLTASNDFTDEQKMFDQLQGESFDGTEKGPLDFRGRKTPIRSFCHDIETKKILLSVS